MIPDVVTLPCGSCSLCCKREFIVLDEDEGDDPTLYDPEMLYTMPLPYGPAFALAHKPNGDCIALGPQGCTIYEIRPAVCRLFDCRAAYLKGIKEYSRRERRHMATKGHLDPKVFKQGKKMLDESLADDRPDCPPVPNFLAK